MPDNLNEYFRCLQTNAGWEFQVGVIVWEAVHTHSMGWRCFRRWKTPPSKDRLHIARTAALATPRFFRTCKTCQELLNVGQMHNLETCQACATKKIGIAY